MTENNFPDITVIIDTREQQPWSFEHYAVAHKKLDTGDYSIEGMETKLAIERKKSVNEIANNVTEKRFKDVLERLSSFEYAFILLEFNINSVLDYPVGSNLPKRMWDKVRISPAFLIKNILDWQIKHNINVIFCGSSDNATTIAQSIFKRVYYIELNKIKDSNKLNEENKNET